MAKTLLPLDLGDIALRDFEICFTSMLVGTSVDLTGPWRHKTGKLAF
jgi:hypothetical protein